MENTGTVRWVKKTLLLDTDVPTFMTWLGEHLSEVSALRRFPADRGYFVLNELPVPWWTLPIPATRVIEIEGRRVFIEDGREQDAIDTPWLIRLEVFRLNKDRTEVKAECREPSHGIRAYFDELTEAIEMRWSKLNDSNARPSVNQVAEGQPESRRMAEGQSEQAKLGNDVKDQRRATHWSVQAIAIALLILGVLITLTANVASTTLPKEWEPYLWLSWPLLLVLVVISAILLFWQGKKTEMHNT